MTSRHLADLRVGGGGGGDLYICISCGFMFMPMCLFIVIVPCICHSPVYGGNKEYLLTYLVA